MELAKDVSIQVIIIFFLMAIGFIFTKTGKLSEKGIKEITNIVLTIVTPCVLINSYQQKTFNADLAKELIFAAAISLVVQIFAILLGMLVFKKDSKEHFRINIFCTAYSNCGFMAIPLLQATLGDNGVFYGSAYLAVFSILSWTHGIYLMSGNKKEISFKNLIKNPGVIGVVVALFLFVFNIKLPLVVGNTVGYIADLNTPLAMIVLGTYLVQIKPKDFIQDKDIYLSMLTRLLIVPLAGILISLIVPIDSSIKMAVLIPAACPAATVSALFASKYNKDADYACEVVSISTLLSVITIPVIIIIANIVGM